MNKLFILFLAYCLTIVPGFANLNYYPTFGGGAYADGFAEWERVDNPEVRFYGFDESGCPGVRLNPNVTVLRWSGSGAAVFLPGPFLACIGDLVRIGFNGSYADANRSREFIIRDDEGGLLDIPSIDGSGESVFTPLEQLNGINYCFTEFQTQVFFARDVPLNGCLILYPAIGYSYIDRKFTVSSHLQNYDIEEEGEFDHGTISEKLSTCFQGGLFEIGIVTQLSCDWVFMIVPTVGVYFADTDFHGTQTWGDSNLEEVQVTDQNGEVAYQLAGRVALSYESGCYRMGGTFFGEFISHVPGIFNPVSVDEGPSRILGKNSTRWGGGVFFGVAY